MTLWKYRLSGPPSSTHTHTHMCISMCVIECVLLSLSLPWSNNSFSLLLFLPLPIPLVFRLHPQSPLQWTGRPVTSYSHFPSFATSFPTQAYRLYAVFSLIDLTGFLFEGVSSFAIVFPLISLATLIAKYAVTPRCNLVPFVRVHSALT